MKLRIALLLSLILLLRPLVAWAHLTQETLSQIKFEDRRGVALPGNLRFASVNNPSLQLSEALANKPALLLFADYTCNTMCGVTFDALARSLAQMPADTNAKAHVLVVGLDPGDGQAEANTFREAHLRQRPVNADFEFLTGSAGSIAALTKAVGLTYAYDSEQDQFAHPIGVVVITNDGHISNILDWQALTPLDLRLALLEAAQDKSGSLSDRVAMLCYGWDAARGVYTLQIKKLLGLASLATVLALGMGVVLLINREKCNRIGGTS